MIKTEGEEVLTTVNNLLHIMVFGDDGFQRWYNGRNVDHIRPKEDRESWERTEETMKKGK